jgi:hypothetical protein
MNEIFFTLVQRFCRVRRFFGAQREAAQKPLSTWQFLFL